MMRTSCPACSGTDLHEIYRLDAIPVQSCILLGSPEEARAFPTAPMVLMFCDTCGFIFNSAFDASKVDYESTTEESQHFSGTFNRFARKLAAEITESLDMKGKNTLEIGSGKGEFLRELATTSGTIGLGVDPGFIPERLQEVAEVDITFRREFFAPENITVAPDLVVCRHTLEHIGPVKTFVEDVAKVLSKSSDAMTFFETPDVRRVLAEGAFWDIYYEHCSYFTLGSHARLFRAAGFDVTRLYLDYDDQYIIQYARKSAQQTRLTQEDDLDELRALAAAFPDRVRKIRDDWKNFVADRKAQGKSIALWGGGSKGVSFLTTNDLDDQIARVIDINPFKQGKFLPVTAHQVQAPEALLDDPPDTIIVMNPIYLDEIRAHLNSLGLNPELVAV
ncbi:methyltransferase domain-containing protein [Pontibaca sp. S1109L]|uniref:Methyltransferase domain-containing protein n=2 Tax=Pontibaca salina TaxID=2795731 RepID=A0A934HVF9_9RHOB|nr:methyltransferase domain-containing protein [Pontibaca salina]